MTYDESIEYLFNITPLFQNVGAAAYKEGLERTLLLDAHFGHPHRRYMTIHVAGTNGKGSVSHTLAAILQCCGYKVGLFTSPHLVDFRERIRVNGAMIAKDRVAAFISDNKALIESIRPSFFEITTALAFQYFAEQQVDIAVIEVGLGGRLDCTNIISPVLSVITNISHDHTAFLGSRLSQIAYEKAGIIKPHTPVVIGECLDDPAVTEVFMRTAQACQAPIVFAEQHPDLQRYGELNPQLTGDCQQANTRTILCAVDQLTWKQDLTRKQDFSPALANSLPSSARLSVSEELSTPLCRAVQEGFAHVCELTGLMGRWQQLGEKPRIICDTGHNVGGWRYLSAQLARIENLHVVFGMVSDKDITQVLAMLPRHAHYYFTQASVARALPVEQLAAQASAMGLYGTSHGSVAQAVEAAKAYAGPDDTIFVGGSTFVVADFLRMGE